MTKILGISGSGIGAGKSSFAKKMAGEVWSLAGALRKELTKKFPGYKWYDKSQEYKNMRFTETIFDPFLLSALEKTKTHEGGKTVRDVMIAYGQMKCANDPKYWPRILAADLQERLKIMDGVHTVAIDDIRKVLEVEYLREKFAPNFIHFHIDTGSAIGEDYFDNDLLAEMADYTVKWEKK